MKVSINLKEINLLKFTTADGKTTTGVYVPETSIQNKETELQIPSDAMSERYSNDTRMGDVMK